MLMKHTHHILPIAMFVLALGFNSTPSGAKNLNPQEALTRYESVISGNMNNPSRNHARLKSSDNYSLYHTELADSSSAVYLFSETAGQGYVLLSADDSTAPLLGYSDSAQLPSDASLLPPAFKYWLRTLARQVKFNVSNQLSAVSQKIIGNPIAPLTTTRWNQDLPYSYYCPMAGEKRCYTGCVATALAQIMKYHNYPPKGAGSHSYGWKNPVTEVDTTLSFDFADTEFKWDLMQDKYDSDTPWHDKMAVATLMYACGVAVNMGYGPWSSGAGTNAIGPAMVNYFGYDKGIRNYIRDYYGIDEWNEIVYNQLKDFGPVQYSGFGDTDGHSFIIDGYSTDGYFHVNWGWGGMSDGYFLLTALDPLEQGIGGAEQAFDFSQDFVGNVSTGGKSTEMYEEVLLDNAFGLEQKSAKPGDALHVWGGSFNYSVGPIPSIMFGAMMIPQQGADTLYLTGPEFTDLKIGGGVRPYDVKLPDTVPAGNYSLVPAFRNSKGVWCKIPVKIGFTNHYDAVSDGSTIVFSKGGEAAIVASGVNSPSQIKLNEKFEVTALLKNSTDEEFFGSVCVALFNQMDNSGATATATDDKPVVKSDAVPVDVLPGQSLDFKYQALFDPADNTLKAGSYDLYICHQLNGTYTKISSPVTVNLSDSTPTFVENPLASPVATEYYTLLGIPVSASRLQPGIYIRIITTTTGKTADRIVIP